jgi:hypothetical protein
LDWLKTEQEEAMKGTLAVLAGLLMMLAGQALAGPGGDVVGSSPANPGLCGGNPGSLLVNVVQQVSGDIDTGVTSNSWASDTYSRSLQVWQAGPDTFCVDVRYLGSFVTVSGPSPQGAAVISAGIAGTFKGGYRGTVQGTLNSNPSKATKGYIGQIDYGCAAGGACSNRNSWLTYYFNPGYALSYDFWGWVYEAGSNGSWVHASSGNKGDITP